MVVVAAVDGNFVAYLLNFSDSCRFAVVVAVVDDTTMSTFSTFDSGTATSAAGTAGRIFGCQLVSRRVRWT